MRALEVNILREYKVRFNYNRGDNEEVKEGSTYFQWNSENNLWSNTKDEHTILDLEAWELFFYDVVKTSIVLNEDTTPNKSEYDLIEVARIDYEGNTVITKKMINKFIVENTTVEEGKQLLYTIA